MRKKRDVDPRPPSGPDPAKGAGDTVEALDDALRERLISERLDDADSARADDDVASMLGRLKTELRQREASRSWRLRDRLSSLPGVARIAFVIACSLAVALVVGVATPRPDLDAYPASRMAAALCALLAITFVTTWAAQRPWHRPALPRATIAALCLAALGAVFALAAAPVAHVLPPLTSPGPGEALYQHAGRCLMFGLACGLPVFALCRWIGRAAPFTGLMAALTAGAVGNVALQLHCPITERAHLLSGHASMAVASIIIAAAWLVFQRKRRAAIAAR